MPQMSIMQFCKKPPSKVGQGGLPNTNGTEPVDRPNEDNSRQRDGSKDESRKSPSSSVDSEEEEQAAQMSKKAKKRKALFDSDSETELEDQVENGHHSTKAEAASKQDPPRKTPEEAATPVKKAKTVVKKDKPKEKSSEKKGKAGKETSKKTDVVVKQSKKPVREQSSPSKDDGVENGADVDTAVECGKSPEKKNIHSLFMGSNKSSSSNANSEKNAIAEFDPSPDNFDPFKSATWKRGQRVPYLALAQTLAVIEEHSSRLKIINILGNYLSSVIVTTPEDLLPSIYLCINMLAPAYEGLELGIAEASLMRAVSQATGRSLDKVKKDAADQGDLGLVAESSKCSQKTLFKPAALTVSGVFNTLRDAARMSGSSAMTKKIDKVQSLIVAGRGVEARFLVRFIAGKLRIGLAEQSVLQAIAQACVLTPPDINDVDEQRNVFKKMRGSTAAAKNKIADAALVLKTTYAECPSYDKIIPTIIEHGLDSLRDLCHITPSIPLKPMLAHPTKGVDEVLQRFEGQQFTCEWKYDGERAQIHLTEDGQISVYSRNLENNTTKFPDIVARFRSCLKQGIKSCIVDSEAVAWDIERKEIRPFQILSTRKRKDAKQSDITVQVCIFAFDLLFLNGESLVERTFSDRRQLLHDNFQTVENEFQFATAEDLANVEEIQEFLEVAIKGKCEGLMVKTLDDEATYQIARRSHNWLKLKKDYLEGLGDTLDLVVIGGYLGRGKRTGVYGGFLLACYDPDTEEYQSICKIGTGFTEEKLQEISERLKESRIPKSRSYFLTDPSLAPDHWFDIPEVWEVKCADLSLSPVHKAAIGTVDNSRGVSLRFPRFITLRTDKKPEDATTASQVADMYEKQESVKSQQKGKKRAAADDDFY